VDSTGGNQRLRELFYQLQVLQQEVQELRGLVEEQNYQLSRLARDQQEQYIDLDRRVAQLAQASAGAGPPGSANTGALPGQGMPPSTSLNAGTGGTFPRTPIATTILATGGGEREAYTGAFDLMKARQFDESAMAFNQLIVAYPNGQYTPNAFYWLGELYLASEDVEKARQSFAQVLNLYPDHPKIADTLYKLGVVYHRLGDGRRSVEYFNRVQTEYPQSSAANLAASYAAEIR
jgi:tol-pal system protein YbgF